MRVKRKISQDQHSITVDMMTMAAYRVFKQEAVGQEATIDGGKVELAVVNAFIAAEAERNRFIERFSGKGIDCGELQATTEPVAAAFLMASKVSAVSVPLLLGFARGLNAARHGPLAAAAASSCTSSSRKSATKEKL